MIQKIRNNMGKFGDNKGFTLVEMALVLIIIGIIIGAVVKGKDLVRGAENKKIYSKFLSEWRLAYLNFYDRTGKILGDTYSLAAPVGAGQDGQADTAGGVAGVPTPAGQAALLTSTIIASYRGLRDVGLEVPTTNTANPWQYNYVDSLGSTHTLDIAFEWDGTNNYNYMMINSLPGELAMALDTMIDGKADGTIGDFVNYTALGVLADWPAVPTDNATDARWRMKF